MTEVSFIVFLLLCVGAVAAWVLLLVLVEGLRFCYRTIVPRAENRALIAGALAEGLRRRRPIDAVLRPLALQVDFPLNRRVTRAGEEARQDPGGDLGALLLRNHLLPDGALRDLSALEAAEPGQAPALLRTLADPPPSNPWLAGALVYLLYLVVYSHLIGNLLATFKRVCTDLGVGDNAYMRFLLGFGSMAVPGLWLLVLGSLVFPVLAGRCGWLSARPCRGRLLLDGLHAGRGEGELASAIAAVWPRLAVRARAAAAAGDLPALLRVCGWRVRDAAGLRASLERRRARVRFLGACASVALRLALPLVFGVLVAMAALAIYGTLIELALSI